MRMGELPKREGLGQFADSGGGSLVEIGEVSLKGGLIPQLTL